MNQAYVAHENIGGFAGVAHCYKLDPPLNGEQYVTVFVTDPQWGPVEAIMVEAYESGAAKRMNRLPGSYVHPDATHSGALWLNGYEIIANPEPAREDSDNG